MLWFTCLRLMPQPNPKVDMLRRIYLFDSCSERELLFLASKLMQSKRLRAEF